MPLENLSHQLKALAAGAMMCAGAARAEEAARPWFEEASTGNLDRFQHFAVPAINTSPAALLNSLYQGLFDRGSGDLALFQVAHDVLSLRATPARSLEMSELFRRCSSWRESYVFFVVADGILSPAQVGEKIEHNAAVAAMLLDKHGISRKQVEDWVEQRAPGRRFDRLMLLAAVDKLTPEERAEVISPAFFNSDIFKAERPGRHALLLALAVDGARPEDVRLAEAKVLQEWRSAQERDDMSVWAGRLLVVLGVLVASQVRSTLRR